MIELITIDPTYFLMGGFLSGLFHAIRNPIKAVTHLIKNPASAIVPKPVRTSSTYRNVVRPVVKVGAGAAAGFLMGGPAGAVAGGITSGVGGGLTNNPFRPLPNLVGPAAVSGVVGGFTGAGAGGKIANFGRSLLSNPSSAGPLAGGPPITPNTPIAGSGNLSSGANAGSLLSQVGSFLGKNAGSIALGLGQIAGAVLSSNAARKAAAIQAQSAAAANDTTLAMYHQNRADLAPWATMGGAGLAQLGSEIFGQNAPLLRRFGAADFAADPGYQFRKAEGQKAIDHRLASIGMNQSGQSVKEASRFNQGVADQAYQDAYNRFNQDQTTRFNRLNALSSTGVNAAGRVAGLGTNAAQTVGTNQIGSGNAMAAGKIGSSNAYLNALNNINQIGANNRFINRLGGIA